MLNKHGFKLLFESDSIVISKGGVYVGKSYVTNGMYKLNTINEISSSTYILASLNIWDTRLGHVYYHSMKNMSNQELIPKLNFLTMHDKSFVSVNSKIAKKPFKRVREVHGY